MWRTPQTSDDVITCWDQDLSFEMPTLPHMVDGAAIQRLLSLAFNFVKGKHVEYASELDEVTICWVQDLSSEVLTLSHMVDGETT